MQVKTLLGIVAFAGISQMASASDFVCTQNGDWNVSSTWGGAGVPGANDYARVPSGKTVTVAANQTESIGILDVSGVLNIDDNAILVVDGQPSLGDTGYVTTAPFLHTVDGQINLIGDSASLQFSDRDQVLDDGDTGSGVITMSDPNAAIQIQGNRKLTSRIIVQGEGYIMPLSGTATFEAEQRTSSVGAVVRANASNPMYLNASLKLLTVTYTDPGLTEHMPQFIADGSSAELRFLREHDGSPDPALRADVRVQNCGSLYFGQSIVTAGSFFNTSGHVSFAASKSLTWSGTAGYSTTNSPLSGGPFTYSCP